MKCQRYPSPNASDPLYTGHPSGINSYTILLSDRDTGEWAQNWPASTTRYRRIAAFVDRNGLCELTVDGKSGHDEEIDRHELEALISDHLPKDCRHLWPTWEQTAT